MNTSNLFIIQGLDDRNIAKGSAEIHSHSMQDGSYQFPIDDRQGVEVHRVRQY